MNQATSNSENKRELQRTLQIEGVLLTETHKNEEALVGKSDLIG